MPETAAFCLRCGRRMIAAPASAGSTGPLTENIAGALAYLTFIPAIIFVRVKPFRQNHFVRFHSFQSLFLTGAVVAIAVLMRLIFYLLALLPLLGYLVAWLAVMMVSLALVMVWLVAIVKAFQGELFKIPVIGDLAEKA